MKKIFIILFLISSSLLQGQDFTFSQFDLNMMYMNPALTGIEQDSRLLTNFRNQWNGLNENFNTNYIEFSLSLSNLTRRRLSAGELSASGGIFLIEDRTNTVFKSHNIGIVPIAIHSKLFRNMYLSTGISNTIRINSIDWNSLVFTDQLNDFNNNISVSNAQLPYYLNQKIWIDPSIGLVLTKHSNLNRKYSNTSFIGLSWHHFVNPIKSFYNNQSSVSTIPQKFILHAEHNGSITPSSKHPFKFWKLIYKHSKQGNKATQKDDVGLSVVLEKGLQLELGCFYRLARENNITEISLMNESVTPLIRIRMQIGRSTGLELSYSYDYTVSKLKNINTFSTNEISLNIYHHKRVRNTICPFQGDNKTNRKWDDIMLNKNGYQTKNRKRRAIW